MSASTTSEKCSIKRPCSENSGDLPECKYGAECYRKNPLHFREYSHPSPHDASAKRRKTDQVADRNAAKLVCAKRNRVPFLLTSVRGIDKKYNDDKLAISLVQILQENSENLRASIQFNYMFDLPWLISKYPEEARSKPLLIVHGHTDSGLADLQGDAMNYKNVQLLQPRLPIMFGTHHTKMMLLFYTDGMRVVIHTANMIEQDWGQKTQGLWKSPLFPKLDSITSRGYSPQNDTFKKDLMDYINAYDSPKFKTCLRNIEEHNMMTAGVHIIASVPGRHTGGALNKWGHLKLRSCLRQYGPKEDFVSRKWPVIGQFSSIGSLGPDSSKWLCNEWLISLSKCRGSKLIDSKSEQLKLVFPSVEDVRNSLEGYSAGGSLPYASDTAKKQPYLVSYLHRWKSSLCGRSKASPHIKSYARISQDNHQAAWFMVTSANLSKAAWGQLEKNQSQLMIRSFEIGVLFLPKEEELSVYNIAEPNTDSKAAFLQLPFDVPLTKYTSTDKPWIWNNKYTDEDCHGRIWNPSW